MTWFDSVPKVELHLHLEGAIPHVALWELVRKYGGDPSLRTLNDLESRFEYVDFPHFLDTWAWKNGFLREYEDFTFIAEAVARKLQAQNIRYVEAFYSPPDFARHGLEIQRLTEAIRNGLSQVPGIEIMLVADVVRDYGPQQAMISLQRILEVRDLGVIGIGLGGAEHEYPPELFQDVFGTAREAGLRTTAHAGEGAGAASVRRAIEDLHVDRIGHGVRLHEDEELLDRLVRRRIPLEMCPLSNVRTGVVASIGEHPIRAYFERGVLVTVNTDDPEMFGNSLACEFQLLEQELGFSRTETRHLILNGIESSWLAEDRKLTMSREFQHDPLWAD